MTTNATQNSQTFSESIKSFAMSMINKESGPALAGLALGLISGPVGFVAGYAGLSTYRQMRSSESVPGRLVTFGVALAASVAATIGLGDAFGSVGLVSGAISTTVAMSYVTGGLGKSLAFGIASKIRGRTLQYLSVEQGQVPQSVTQVYEPAFAIANEVGASKTQIAAVFDGRLGAKSHARRFSNRRSVGYQGRVG